MEQNKPAVAEEGVAEGTEQANTLLAGAAVPGLDKLRESLSAMMDDESDALELRRVLREQPAQAELASTWRRYHAVRASIRQEIHSGPAVNLLDGIHARFAAEAELQPRAARSKLLHSGVLRFIGQGAIATSVAVAALMSVSYLETAQTGAPNNVDMASIISASALSNGTPDFNGDFNASEISRTVSTDPEAESYDRLKQAVYHEFSSMPKLDEFPGTYTTPAESR